MDENAEGKETKSRELDCGGTKRLAVEGLLDLGWGELSRNDLLDKIQRNLRYFSLFAYRGHKPSQILLSNILKILPQFSLENSGLKVPASVARVMEMRMLMSVLSAYVKPTRNNGSDSTLHGSVELDIAAPRDRYYDLVETYRKRGMTLKSLAVRVFISDLHREGITTIDERVVARDFDFCKRWEAQNPNMTWIILGIRGDNDGLPFVNGYSDWKSRSRGRRHS